MKISTSLTYSVFFVMILLLSACGSETTNGETDTGNNTSEPQNGAFDLSLRLTPGNPFVWKISWNDETVTQVPDEQRGEGWNDVMDATGYSLIIETVADEILGTGEGKMNANVLEVTSYYNGTDQAFTYNSNEPATEPQSMGYHFFHNRNLKYTMAKNGSISDLQGGKEIYANFGDPDLMNIGNLYTAEILQVYSYLLPENPVKIGDSWKITHKYSAGTGLIMDLTLTLNAVAGNIGEVAIESHARKNPDAIPTRIGESSFTYDIAGSGTGTLNVDLTTGLPVHMVHSFNLTGNTIFEVPDQEEPKKYFTTKGFFFELQTL